MKRLCAAMLFVCACTFADGQNPILKDRASEEFGFRLERNIVSDEVTVYLHGLYESVRITAFEDKMQKGNRAKGFVFHVTGTSEDECAIKVMDAKAITSWVNFSPITMAADGKSFKDKSGGVYTLEKGLPLKQGTRNVEGPLEWTKKENLWRVTDYADPQRPETKRTWLKKE